MTDAQPMTGDDLLKLPRGEGQRHELIAGEIRTMPPAGDEHGRTGGNLLIRLGGYLMQHPIGRLWLAESGFYTRSDNRTVRAPDIAFALHEALGESQKGFAVDVPTLVVEVISPHDQAADIERKTAEWLNFGVAVVWNIYPDSHAVHCFYQGGRAERLSGDDVLTAPDILPGFSVPLPELFAL